MTQALLKRIAAGRTDLIVDFIAGGASASSGWEGTSLIKWYAYYGDVNALRYLLMHESLHELVLI